MNGEVANPRHWFQVVALGKALRLNIYEVNQLLGVTKIRSFSELRELARYEYELELLDEFAQMETAFASIPRPQSRVEPCAVLELPA